MLGLGRVVQVRISRQGASNRSASSCERAGGRGGSAAPTVSTMSRARVNTPSGVRSQGDARDPTIKRAEPSIRRLSIKRGLRSPPRCVARVLARPPGHPHNWPSGPDPPRPAAPPATAGRARGRSEPVGGTRPAARHRRPTRRTPVETRLRESGRVSGTSTFAPEVDQHGDRDPRSPTSVTRSFGVRSRRGERDTPPPC